MKYAVILQRNKRECFLSIDEVMEMKSYNLCEVERAFRIAIEISVLVILMLVGGAGATAGWNSTQLTNDIYSGQEPGPKTLIVDDSGGAEYNRIQDAIDAASPGDTIEVYSGTYYENVNVTKQLTMVGVDTGMGQPVVDAGESGSAIALSVDGTVLEGFTVVNSLYSWRGAGIMVISKNNIISGNNLSSNRKGIYLLHSSNNTITGNIASENKEAGIYIEHSSNNTITGNIASENKGTGIFFISSSGNILRNNHMFTNNYNFGLSGWRDADFNNDIDTSNVVDGKYIYYLLDASDIIIDSDSNAGTVYCINCDNITVKDLNLTNNSVGVYFFDTHRSTIQGNHITSNKVGIRLEQSSNNSITMNNASNNDGGILFKNSGNNIITGNIAYNNFLIGMFITDFSNNNTIVSNNVSNNNFFGIVIADSGGNTVVTNYVSNNYNTGIFLSDSNNNTIAGNNIIFNKYGIDLSSSSSNFIYDNYLNNTNNAIDNGNNSWNITKIAGTNIIGGLWLGGNYWSDYNGFDVDGD
ncbi:MAG: right-handed parallel beta-helix repeat-containing protein, partial [Methanococcoides sp.]|nr:right-handed parallel beta-helix repeat-containing protein [Methanococcoides sp.]